MPPLKTKRGRLTAYGLACGYIESKSVGDVGTTLHREHGVYHVRQFDRRPEASVFRTLWRSFSKLREARACFNRQPGRFRALR
jgi:hypothetical protein